MTNRFEDMENRVEDMEIRVEATRKEFEDLKKHLDDRDASYAQYKLYKQILHISGERFRKKLFKKNNWPESGDGT